MGIKTNEIQRLDGVQGTDSILADTQAAGTGRLSFDQAAQFFDRELMRSGTAVERALSSKAELGRNSRNILINWDFRRPVNRNGRTRYTESGYTIDRWKTMDANGTVTVREGTVDFANTSGAAANCSLMESTGVVFPSVQTVTFSVMAAEGTGALFLRDTQWETYGRCDMDGPGVYHVTAEIPAGRSIVVQIRTDASVSLVAAKLELGERQTLAHKEGDAWVLNDPPDYALQYALCSQYSPITGEWVGSRHSNQNLLDNSYWMERALFLDNLRRNTQ